MRVFEVSSCIRGGRLAAPLLALSLLAGCESDTAELIRDIEAARAGCTQEKLQAGDEECVQMMERYAEMGSEAIRTYIGAVKSMDQALQRMPPPAFDTTGLGHALTRPPSAYLYGQDSLSAAGGAYAPGYDYPAASRALPQLQAAPDGYGWGQPAYGREPGGAHAPSPYDRSAPHPGGYGPSGYGSERYGSERYGSDRGGYDRDGYDEYGEPYPEDARYADPYAGPSARAYRGGAERGYSPRDGYAAPGDEAARWRNARERLPYPYRPEQYERLPQGRAADPRALPPERGQLLPPEERLRRPWLEDPRLDPRDPRARPRYAPEPQR